MTDPHLCRCGRAAYRPDPVTSRRPARRCSECHHVVGLCRCAPAASDPLTTFAAGEVLRAASGNTPDSETPDLCGRETSPETSLVLSHVLTERNIQRERGLADDLLPEEWDGLIRAYLAKSHATGRRYVRLVQVAALAVAAAEQVVRDD